MDNQEEPRKCKKEARPQSHEAQIRTYQLLIKVPDANFEKLHVHKRLLCHHKSCFVYLFLWSSDIKTLFEFFKASSLHSKTAFKIIACILVCGLLDDWGQKPVYR
jgi:hypothetical protein